MKERKDSQVGASQHSTAILSQNRDTTSTQLDSGRLKPLVAVVTSIPTVTPRSQMGYEEMKRNLPVCFTDYAEAFNRTRYEELFKILHNIDSCWDTRMTRNLYWDQTAATIIETGVDMYVRAVDCVQTFSASTSR
ncbi:hypothetical protein ElyMa_001149500 [Elysia marginata]|uniref:Uncharacterized protein n=1 Tax=Elysia marginata TaxID=1093978 RepID=A0AAV4I363_9GAST|nr:hypothetical protein ElyMa_001149500 [Elysia marginata]